MSSQRIVFDEMGTGPEHFAARLPLADELIRFLPGDDRSDYCLERRCARRCAICG